MRQFNIYKTMMKYLTDENLSLNAKGLLSIILFQDEIVGTEIEKLCTDDKETIKILTENNKSLELRVSNLTSKNSKQEERIDELRKDNFNLKCRVQQLEDFFNKLIKLIKNMFKRSDKKEQYVEFANDLYGHQIISDKTMEDIRNAYYTKTKEKDDFEL